MQVTGTVYKIEEYKDKKGTDRRRLVLCDRASNAINAQAEEVYFEVPLQGDGKDLKLNDLVTFWGRLSFFQNGRAGFQVKGEYKVVKS